MVEKNDEEKKSLFGYTRENGWKTISAKESAKIESYAKGYIAFLSRAKTEREAHDIILAEIKKSGYRNIDDIKDSAALKSGDKIYRSCHGRTLFCARIGKRPIAEGLNIIGGHIDSPRLDLKQSPLYEDSELALFDTHYYGGIKKYQWVTIPLALHGVVVKRDGSKAFVTIGEADDDPVLTITDLLPHLGKDQVKKTLEDGIAGEGLNILIGSRLLAGFEGKNKVKENILKILHDRYGIIEEDFQSADLEVVPAGKARECGIDRSMILGYGQDDRIASYAAYRALLDLDKIPQYTAVALMCDKEEIGSSGATGMASTFFENTVALMVHKLAKQPNDIIRRRALERSWMLSADVSALHDPNYPDVSAPNGNMAAMNNGVVIEKFTGSRGKSGASEASAEFVSDIRRVFSDAGVLWQCSELGKVDVGGGGTIALFLARYGMNVLDCGPGLLSMHAPWEVSSKLDAYMTWKAYKAFYESNVVR
jgi:aspartyl aminopeptidase